MVATILKSKRAVKTSIAIIETFSKIREMVFVMSQTLDETDQGVQRSMIKRSGEIMSEILNENLQISDTETTIEVNFAMLKFKHTVKRKKDQ